MGQACSSTLTSRRYISTAHTGLFPAEAGPTCAANVCRTGFSRESVGRHAVDRGAVKDSWPTLARALRHGVVAPGTEPVGASLLAKTELQSKHLQQMCRPFASKLTPTEISGPFPNSPATPSSVGASLLAKTELQPKHLQRMCRTLREQAHSHRNLRAIPDLSGDAQLP